MRPATFADVTEDHVLIRDLPHASSAIPAKDGTLAVTGHTGLIGRPDVLPTVVTMNNSHSTHWTPDRDPRIDHMLNGWPTHGKPADHRLDLGVMLVRNVTPDTRGPFGKGARADCSPIFIFQVAGLCRAHLGQLHQILSPEQYAAIGRVDILMVPVDGGHRLRLQDMIGVVQRLKSGVVIPMHGFSGASLPDFPTRMQEGFDGVETGLDQMEFPIRKRPARPTIPVPDPRLLDD